MSSTSTPRRLLLRSLALAGFSCLAALPALGQSSWPSKPVRIVVPFAAGGTTDILARAIAPELSKAFGQPFVIDNRGGAGGNLGTDGSVAFMFKHCGLLLFSPGTDEGKLMDAALEAGAEDVVTHDDGVIEVLTATGDFEAVKNALQAAGLVAEEATITMRAQNTIELEGEDAVRMQKLLDVLEDLDDTQEIFHNAAL